MMGQGATTARLDLPPLPTARAVFAPDFGRRFLLFADAEEEFDWTKPLRRDQTATTAIAHLSSANRRFTAAGLIPTYMLDFPVVDSPASADILRGMLDAGECEVGAQLHPWVTPPFDEDMTPANSFAGNLPLRLEQAKLRTITGRVTETMGVQPLVYRAGRYGIGRNSAALLAEEGYQLDVSVRTLFDYRDQDGPDFTQHPAWSWWIADGLLELPMSSVYTGPWRRWPGVYRAARLRGPLAATGLLNRPSLTPEGTPLAEALAGIRRMLADGMQLFSLSFHTPSLEPGHTPYVRDQADLRRFWRWWDGIFDLFAREGVQPARASELISAARRQ